ncbi:hemin uptake protein HemP [Parasulfuritortus cantonensis]|uniref:Hemin uptake protein HemP n=1 Tax=Parasulfuritortus cantonensis TaxID=2528202 RepID=A0A4R1BEI5_9PROT|nr:hemin uptake protein HemP [Parasulfuritortus cantonensis]TCJ15520.1 hemin uptake protein HemP [Parasulfuritortus cantonensis]
MSDPKKTGIPSKPSCPVYRSEALFAGAKVLVIVHDGREYQLRITNANKLILTA